MNTSRSARTSSPIGAPPIGAAPIGAAPIGAALIAAGAICLALAGCSLQGSANVAGKTSGTAKSASSDAATTSDSAGSGASTSDASGSDATSPSTPATSSTANHAPTKAGPAACKATQLKITSGGPDAGAGQVYLPVVFTNISAATCTLTGYPGVAGLNAAGHQIVQAGRDTTSKVVAITLKPGKKASAAIHAANVPSGTATSCPPSYAAVLVTPPNTTTSTKLVALLPSCGGLQVNAVNLG